MDAFFPTTCEEKLLLAVCQRYLGRLSDSAWLSQLGEKFDEKKFLDLSLHHRLLLLIHEVLIKQHSEFFSAEFLCKTEALIHKERGLSLQMAFQTLQLSKDLRNSRIPHLFFKGPLLGASLFPNKILRSSRDIDVWVPPESLLGANECLNRLGFFTPDPMQAIKNASGWLSIFRGKDIIYQKPGMSFPIELHWKTSDVELLLDRQKIISNITSSQCFHGENLPVLSEPLNFIYLCQHGARHHWFRLRWLMDIAILVNENKVDLIQVQKEAAKLKTMVPVLEALLLIKTWLKVPSMISSPISKQTEKSVYRRFLLAKPEKKCFLGSLELVIRRTFLTSDLLTQLITILYNLVTLPWVYINVRLQKWKLQAPLKMSSRLRVTVLGIFGFGSMLDHLMHLVLT